MTVNVEAMYTSLFLFGTKGGCKGQARRSCCCCYAFLQGFFLPSRGLVGFALCPLLPVLALFSPLSKITNLAGTVPTFLELCLFCSHAWLHTLTCKNAAAYTIYITVQMSDRSGSILFGQRAIFDPLASLSCNLYFACSIRSLSLFYVYEEARVGVFDESVD